MSVPFLDLERLHASIRPALDACVDRVVSSSSFVGGREVQAFEEEFASAHGLGRGAGCGSGTDALALALRALGIGPGDEVIVPSMTFVATAEAVVHAGAVPVLADVDDTTLLLTAESVAAVRSANTTAVIPVHLYGHMVDPALMSEWRASGLRVVEDAAQAHLAERDGVRVGHAGDAACFSFYPGKNLGALGDGGMVISRDPALVDEVRRIRDHGRTGKYVHDVVGWCSRLDGLQAAFLRAKLVHLPDWTESRRAFAALYSERLGDLLVPWTDGAVHHLLVSRVPRREEVQAALGRESIGSGIHYPVPLSRQPWLAGAGKATPAAELASEEVLSLPMDPLMSAHDVTSVARVLREIVGE